MAAVAPRTRARSAGRQSARTYGRKRSRWPRLPAGGCDSPDPPARGIQRFRLRLDLSANGPRLNLWALLYPLTLPPSGTLELALTQQAAQLGVELPLGELARFEFDWRGRGRCSLALAGNSHGLITLSPWRGLDRWILHVSLEGPAAKRFAALEPDSAQLHVRVGAVHFAEAVRQVSHKGAVTVLQ